MIVQAGNISLSGNNGSAYVEGYGGNLLFQPGFAYVSSSAAANSRLVQSGQTIFYYANTNGTYNTDSNLTEAMRINPVGNIGMGTSNPAYKLDVTGDINFTGTLRQNGTAYGGGGSGVSSGFTVVASNIAYTTCNVGIGTTSPASLLHVKSGSNVDSTSQPSGSFAATIYQATNQSACNGLFVKNN